MKRILSCDFRVVQISLAIHFFLLWFSNADLLGETISKVNSQKEYWVYQLCLLCFITIYFVILLVFSLFLKKTFKLSRNRYLVLISSIILPIAFTIRSGTFISKLMSVTNTVGKWYGIKIYRYFFLCVVYLDYFICNIFFSGFNKKKFREKEKGK